MAGVPVSASRDLCDWPSPPCPHLPRLCLNVTVFLSETVCRTGPGTQQVLHKHCGVRTKKGDGPWTAGQSCLPAPQSTLSPDSPDSSALHIGPGLKGTSPVSPGVPWSRPRPPRSGVGQQQAGVRCRERGQAPPVPGASEHSLSCSGQTLPEDRVIPARRHSAGGREYSCTRGRCPFEAPGLPES